MSPSHLRTKIPRLQRGWVVGLTAIGSCLLGPMIGYVLSLLIEARSEWARFVCIAPFPAIFFIGYAVWAARLQVLMMEGIIRGLLKALKQMLLFKRKPENVRDVLPSPEKLREIVTRALSASSSFLWVSLPIGSMAGLLGTTISDDSSFLSRSILLCSCCVIYGVVLRRLGRKGYLPLPEEA